MIRRGAGGSPGVRRSGAPRLRPRVGQSWPDALGSAGTRAAVNLHVVGDITKVGEYSPEVIEAEWIDGATGPEVGARYRGHVKRNENWPVLC